MVKLKLATLTVTLTLFAIAMSCTPKPARPTTLAPSFQQHYEECERRHAECLQKGYPSEATQLDQFGQKNTRPTVNIGAASHCNKQLKACYKRAGR